MGFNKRLCTRAAFAATLAAVSGFFTVHAETCTATNVVVAPLTDAHWTQGAPYNDYSPKGTTVFTSGWEAGCVATAAAQELYYWQWPWRLDAVHETSHPVLNESNLSLRFDGNVPFDWESMQNSYGDGSTLKQKHAAARLVLACQSLVQMQFVSAGGLASKNLPGTMEWFEYAGQVTPRASEANLAALKEDFEWGSPVQTGINFKGYGGHEVVGLGYATGTNSVGDVKNLIWLNLGWGGSSDGWYDLAEATEGETIIKSVQLGFRPIKSVQIEPVAPVSGNSVTLNWHLPNCYTNKISGFTVAKKTPSASTTTWTDDFSTGGKGRSSNTNELLVINERLYGWQGTASGIYTYDDILLLTEDSVLTYKYHDDYMAGCMSVRVEAKIGSGAWQTISKPTLHGGWNYAGATTESVNLGTYAGKYARFRFAVEYTNGSLTQTYAPYVGVNGPNVWFDDLSVSNVKTIETVATDSTIAASARSTTFSGLTTGETYAFSVTPIMSDNSAAVTQTATTTIGTPAATPTINAVTMSPKGSNLVQEGFYADIAMGWNIIDVACSESVTALEAFISHQSVLPQSKIEVVDKDSGNFSINIDATEVAAKWANQKMILTLKATNATGESTYKDVELCLKASGVPENVPGGKVWTGASAIFGAENYTAKWTGNVLPSAGDKVTFKTTDAEFGGEMNLNLSTPTALGYVYATGDGQLTISGTSSETLMANVLKNDIQLEINSSKFKVNTAIPSTNIVIDSGSCLDCEIDQSRSDYIKKVSGGYVSALTDSSLWNGTVVFSGYSADWLNPSSYGSTSSKVRFNGVAGYLAHSNPTFNPTIELVDNGSTPAFDWNNGSSASTATFKGISGDGTFKTSGSSATSERIVINDIGSFTGSFNLASKVITIGTTKGTDASNGRLNFNSGYGATIAGGKTWTIGGGVYLAGNQTLTVNGALSDSGALAAEGTGTVLALAPTATVTAASLSFANNTIRLAKTAEASPTFSVTGAAILTNATIEVALAEGMSVGDSIALMSAGSFEGVDSATLEGLDGYSLEVSGGTLYATKPAEIESPAAAAVWQGDFSSSVDGYTLTDWQQTHGANNSSVTIDRTNQGLFVDFASAKGYFTVLVKYTNLVASSSSKRVLFATTGNSNYTRDRCGIRLLTNSKVQGLWNTSLTANSDVDYDPVSTDTVPSAGTLAFVYDKGTSGTSAYVAGTGESLPSSALWNNTALKAGDMYGLAVGGMCRDAAVNGVEAAKGMTITGLAIFTNVLSAAEMNAYEWPPEVDPGPVYVRDNIVKRADGTVYHDNDANRAIITNWHCQITRPAAPPAPHTIDILYVLDKPSREYIEGAKNMSLDEFFARETAFMNEMLCRTDMDTNFWFRMVGVYPLDVQAQEVSPMLGRCKNSSEPGFELVNEVRNRVGADIVFSVARNGGGIGGLAYVNSYENIVSGAAAPLGHACGFLEYYDMISWIHEIAHVMSCNHMPPTNIDVNNPRHRQFGVVVHDDNATEAPFDYRTIMTGYYYAGQTWCFSSRNHYYNGVQLSVSNHVDATQVMVELAPYVAQWRPTKVPERPEISFFPQNQAEIPAGVETTVTIDYGDPDAEIYWYDATSGEGKADAHPYTGPISVTGGNRNMIYAFAKTNGVEVAESEKTATYFPTGMYGQFDYSVVLDSEGIAWSMPLADSSESAWDKDTQIFCVGESAYQAHVDMESLTNSRPSTCSATARLTLTEAKNLNFRHRDSYTNAMFSVWVDDVPVYYKNGASDTSEEWRKEVVRIEPGTHRIEFIFTQTAEDRVDAQTSEDDDHTLADDEKYQRYIASLEAAETSRVWIDGLEWTPADLIWAGDETTGDGVWSKDTAYTPWEGEVPFADDAVTTFPDLAAGSATVTVKGEVRPGKVNFTGTRTAYTIVPDDDNAFIYIGNGSSIEFKTNATIRVPFRLDAAQIKSAANRTLELGNVFGYNLSGPGNQGTFSGQIAVNSKSTVIMNPGAGRVQTVGDFGKNWSYTDSDLVFTNGTVEVNGVINNGAGLFQYKRIHVKNGAVLELVTNDATGYDVAGNNTIEVERGGELKIDAGDRLRRPMKLSGGTLTVSRSGPVHALALYNAPSFTVTADSVLTNGNAAATLGFVGQDATITLQNNATLDCYVPFANGIMADDSKNVTIAGSGTFVQNALMIQFTNKVTVASGVTFRQNEMTSGMVGKSSWDVNGTLEANAIMQVKALTLASGATLSVKVTDANVSNAAIMCDTTPSLAGSIVVDAASNLANGKYAVISATGLDDGILARVSAPTLARYATFTVEDGGLFMTVAATDTDFRTPHSWIEQYFPELVSDWESTQYNDFATNKNHASVKNGYAPWESYVLGLVPTNELSKFTALIRMKGTMPVIEYSPTNEVLKAGGAIEYILQGKPTLTNDWQDVEFEEPGDTNRFFRVNVTW